jgi:hypothetical protein
MPTSVFTPRELFAELPERSFEDYPSFERILIERFNSHLFDFPPGYGWRDALDWAVRHNVVRREDGRILIELK